MKAGKASANRVHIMETMKPPIGPLQPVSPPLPSELPSGRFPPSDHRATMPRPQHWQEVSQYVGSLEHYWHVPENILIHKTAKYLRGLEKAVPKPPPESPQSSPFQSPPLRINYSSNANLPLYSDRQTLMQSASPPTELQAPAVNSPPFMSNLSPFPPLYRPPDRHG
jgi:hypothetical protein